MHSCPDGIPINKKTLPLMCTYKVAD